MGQQVTEDDELKIHDRLLACDPTAPSDCFELLIDYLIAILRKSIPGNENELYLDACTDVIMSYVQHPQAFNPEIARLSTYLASGARNRLSTSLSRRSSIQKREISLFVVEDRDGETYREMEITDPSITEALIVEDLDKRYAVEKLFEEITDPTERKVLSLMLDGIRETHQFASALGIAGEPLETQRRKVKQVKDQLDKTIERLGAKIRERHK